MDMLVGYTGFVGSNICKSHQFDEVYNSKNISHSFGKKPDLLVYSGVRAEMFLANKDPEADHEVIENAISNIKKIQPKKIVLISTIGVYINPDNVDEDTTIDTDGLPAYGVNRYYLEQWVENNIEDHLIVRLPGLFGVNIKKNFIYDYLHYIPSMLNEEKYENFSAKSNLIKEMYSLQANGFYKCNKESEDLKKEFKKIGFSALNFTDSRGVFQYYHLANLWDDICLAMDNNLKILNVAVEPLSISELYTYLTNEEFSNELAKQPPYFNYKTKYADLWNGHNGYIKSKETVLKEIKEFVESYKEEN